MGWIRGVVQMPDKICKSCKSSVDDVSYFCPHCGEALFEDSATENPFRREAG